MARNVNSIAKGNAGEHDAARKLRDLGFTEAHRDGQQGAGAKYHPDVVGPSGYHLEVKWQERFGGHEMYQALTHADRDRKPSEKLVVLHRKNRKRWVAIMYVDDWADLVHKVEMYNDLIRATTEQNISI